jgi:hypothetical protein
MLPYIPDPHLSHQVIQAKNLGLCLTGRGPHVSLQQSGTLRAMIEQANAAHYKGVKRGFPLT